MTRPLTAPGRLVAGRYRLHEQIGGGGMGAVWLARDELLGRMVAVKQVLPPNGADQDAIDQQRQRALREGRLAARLSHPHAISVYDVALENGQPWLVMEYLPSRSLAAVLSEDGILPVDQVAQIGAQVADALAATHAAGIVHRDVKPANILIGRGGRVEGLVKITDFGISHARDDVSLTQTGQITGTPAFLAPEVAQGHEMTDASDVFSLGATLYTCLEGQPPFGMDDNALAMLHRVANGSIRPPVRAGSLAKPLQKMLAADPADRPSMLEVRDELVKLAAGRDGDTTTVLMARANLTPAAPPRHRTAAFGIGSDRSTAPPSNPDGRAAPPPPTDPPPRPPRTLVTPRPEERPAPPVVPAATSAAADEDEGPRRRAPWIWLAAGLVAAVLAGLIVFWTVVLDEDGAGDTTAAESPAATSSSPAPTPSPTEDTGGENAPAEQEEPPPTPTTAASDTSADTGDPLTADNVEQFLTSFHEQVVSDPRAAYARTGTTLRNAIGSEDAYVEYWSQFSDVRISDIQATDGQDFAVARLTWVRPDGTSESAMRRFNLTVRDGELILESEVNP